MSRVHETPVDMPPLYCEDCGETMLRQETQLDAGYDPFDGTKNPERTHIAMRCSIWPRSHHVWVMSNDGLQWLRV